MSKSRRQFLAAASVTLLGAAAVPHSQAQNPAEQPPGEPPAFGTGPAVGPEVSPATFAEAEKLVQVELNDADRAVAAASWRQNLASLYEARTGPRKVTLEPTLAPASRWNPVLPGQIPASRQDRFVRSKATSMPVPASDDEIAWAPVTQLSRWIDQRKVTSERLTLVYL